MLGLICEMDFWVSYYLYSLEICLTFFEMAAMPFPCKGILVVLGNLPRIFPRFSLIYANFLIPYIKLLIFLIENGLALALNSFGMLWKPSLRPTWEQIASHLYTPFKSVNCLQPNHLGYLVLDLQGNGSRIVYVC